MQEEKCHVFSEEGNLIQPLGVSSSLSSRAMNSKWQENVFFLLNITH